jgi:type IV secretory pathway TrbL component
MNASRKITIGLTLVLTLVLCCCSAPAYAFGDIANLAMAELFGQISDACSGWLEKTAEIAVGLLAITAVIGFAIGAKDLALSGGVTLDGIVALFVRYAFIVGILVWLLNAPMRLGLIVSSLRKIGGAISGQDVTFSGLFSLFDDVVMPLVSYANGLNFWEVGTYICLVFVIFIINCLCFMIAATLLVVELEAIFILIGGMITASFFVIGYFRDLFLGYIKALAAIGMKLLMLSLCLGIMRNIIQTWPAMVQSNIASGESVFAFLTPMTCALIGFYMIVKAVPQFAASVMTGSASGMDGGAVRTAAMAGYGLGATVVSMSRTGAQKMIGGTSTVSQASQAYQQTSQAMSNAGATRSEAMSGGAREAFKVAATGAPSVSSAHASRANAEQIRNNAQYNGQNSAAAPPASVNNNTNVSSQAASGSQAPTNTTSATADATTAHNNSNRAQSATSKEAASSKEAVSSAGSYAAAGKSAETLSASRIYERFANPANTPSGNTGAQNSPVPAPVKSSVSAENAKSAQTDSWGAYASDRKDGKK